MEQRKSRTTRSQTRQMMKDMMSITYVPVKRSVNCPICFESCAGNAGSVPPCGHIICKECVKKIRQCPLCRQTFTVGECYPIYL